MSIVNFGKYLTKDLLYLSLAFTEFCNKILPFSTYSQFPSWNGFIFSPCTFLIFQAEKKTLHTQANFLRNLYCMFFVLCRKFRYLETQNHSLFFKTYYFLSNFQWRVTMDRSRYGQKFIIFSKQLGKNILIKIGF